MTEERPDPVLGKETRSLQLSFSAASTCVGRIRALAAEAVARAVLDAVRSAESLPGLPAVRDLPAPPEPPEH